MSRILRIELRRSAAIGTALLLAVLGVLLLFFVEGLAFSTGWMQLAMSQRLYLAVLWPLALAAGAWQGTREHRSRVGELFASAPRPRSHRAVPTLGAMAIGVVAAYVLMGVAGGLWIIGTARYFPLAVLVVTAVGALALIAAAWLGLAVGRALPWLVTAPALAVAGLGLLLTIPWATRPRGWLALVFSPIYEMNLPDDYATVPGRVSAAQAVWMLALAAAAVLLFTATGRRARLAAVAPVALGAALAIAVMPHQNRVVNDGIDPVARELVCADDAPAVCVSRVHSGLLDELVPHAEEALTVLAKLPGGPTQVHEDTTSFVPEFFPSWGPDTVLLPVDAGQDGHLTDTGTLAADIVAGAFGGAPDCDNRVGPADRTAAAYWLIGREPKTVPDDPDRRWNEQPSPLSDPEIGAEAVALWQQLRDLSADQAQARVLALRKAAVSCTAEPRLFPR